MHGPYQPADGLRFNSNKLLLDPYAKALSQRFVWDDTHLAYRRDSDWRKPKPGMILQTAMELGINLAKSFMVGDRKSDIEAGRAAGCATVFIDLGYTLPAPDAPDYVVHSIAEAANVIIETVLTTQEGP